MQRAEPFLLRVVVDLDHDPVDLVVELRSAALPHATALRDLLDGLEALGERVDREAVPRSHSSVCQCDVRLAPSCAPTP